MEDKLATNRSRTKSVKKKGPNSHSSNIEDPFTADKLYYIIPFETIPSQYKHEIAYSQLLELVVNLFDRIILSPGGSRHDCNAFLRNFATELYRFNAIELIDSFAEKLDALITFSCEMV